jgi:hypothetical protein
MFWVAAISAKRKIAIRKYDRARDGSVDTATSDAKLCADALAKLIREVAEVTWATAQSSFP